MGIAVFAKVSPTAALARTQRFIAPQIRALQTHLPQPNLEIITRFSRGVHALGAYPTFLNETGKLALLRANRIMDMVSGVINSELDPIAVMEEALRILPSVTEPHLEYYNEPFSEEVTETVAYDYFRAPFAAPSKSNKATIEISLGCDHQCLMCGATTDENVRGYSHGPMKHLPFPVALKLFQQLVETGNPLFLYYFNDVLSWIDPHFDADFGDLAKAAINLGYKINPLIVHWLRPGDPYAEPAAAKIRELGIPIDISFHLMHKNFFSSKGEPNKALLKLWAEGYARAIDLLLPENVRLYAHDLKEVGGGLELVDTINPQYGLWNLVDYYQRSVFPLLSPAGKDKYQLNLPTTGASLHRNLVPNFELHDVLADGKAVDQPELSVFGRTSETVSILNGMYTTLHANGISQVSIVEPGPVAVQFSAPKTVTETFPEPQSPAFKWFLYKFWFSYYEYLNSSIALWQNINIEFWEHYCTDIAIDELFRMIPAKHPRYEAPQIGVLQPSFIEQAYHVLKNAPIVSEIFGYDLYVRDLADPKEPLKGSPFESFFLQQKRGKSGDSVHMLDLNFLNLTPEGNAALKAMREDDEIKRAELSGNPSEKALRKAFAFLKDLPVLNPASYLPNVTRYKTLYTLPFKAETGI